MALDSDRNVNVMKFLLIFFNLAFWVSGLALLYIGIWMNSELIQYSEECAVSARTATLLLISAGSLIVMLGALGSCCTLKTNPTIYFWYKTILGLVLLLEIGIIVSICQFKNCLANDHIPSAEDLPDGFMIDMETVDLPQLNDLQSQYECCGIVGYQDWTPNNSTPPSCCKVIGCDTTDNSTIFTEGCYNKVHDVISSKVYNIGIGTGLLLFLPLVGIILSGCMVNMIKKPTEYNRI